MRKIRVLIVDDSTVIRRLLSDILAEDPEIEVAGTAANGKIALSKLSNINPDVVTLDMEMPEMDGLATLTELRKTYPNLPVIMFSTLTSRGAASTLDALSLGANDYVTKPANVGSVMAAMQIVRQELVPKIKGLCNWYRKASASTDRNSRTAIRVANLAANQPKKKVQAEIIAIGVSTGGPNALAILLPSLPKDLPVPIVIVQHMPPIFTKHLADRLNQSCSIEIAEAKAGDMLRPGTAWIAPGNFHMTVKRSGTAVYIETNQDPPENSCRPAVDTLFRSVSATYGSSALACVLTGMGQDGMRGCNTIRDAGGFVIAQDEESSVVWGMPRAVVHAGLADSVKPLDQIAYELESRCSRKNTFPFVQRSTQIASS